MILHQNLIFDVVQALQEIRQSFSGSCYSSGESLETILACTACICLHIMGKASLGLHWFPACAESRPCHACRQLLLFFTLFGKFQSTVGNSADFAARSACALLSQKCRQERIVKERKKADVSSMHNVSHEGCHIQCVLCRPDSRSTDSQHQGSRSAVQQLLQFVQPFRRLHHAPASGPWLVDLDDLSQSMLLVMACPRRSALNPCWEFTFLFTDCIILKRICVCPLHEMETMLTSQSLRPGQKSQRDVVSFVNH